MPNGIGSNSTFPNEHRVHPETVSLGPGRRFRFLTNRWYFIEFQWRDWIR
jgi:hypothetical protein